MLGLASMFTQKEQTLLKESCGIVLSDDKDYTVDEVMDIYDLFTDVFPFEYDYIEDRPTEKGYLFESIVDKLYALWK